MGLDDRFMDVQLVYQMATTKFKGKSEEAQKWMKEKDVTNQLIKDPEKIHVFLKELDPNYSPKSLNILYKKW